jgi:tRNA1Val (adenine37-N6)-methyltransferase
VELGCGTGIVSLLCAARGQYAHVDAVEVQADFAELAARNADLNGLTEKLTVRCADLRDLRAVDFGGEVDAVLANPPYMRADTGKLNRSDAKAIARHELFGGIGDFCAAASRLLRWGGRFGCVWRPDRLIDLLTALREHGLEPKRMTFVHGDASAPASMVLIDARRGGSPGMTLTAPLLLYRDPPSVTPRIMTDAAQAIYQTGRFD